MVSVKISIFIESQVGNAYHRSRATTRASRVRQARFEVNAVGGENPGGDGNDHQLARDGLFGGENLYFVAAPFDAIHCRAQVNGKHVVAMTSAIETSSPFRAWESIAR